MWSLKLILSACFVLFYGRALALNMSSSLENSNEHLQHTAITSDQPKEIHNLFSNSSFAHVYVVGTDAISSDKVSGSTSNNSTNKTASQVLTSVTTETLKMVTPTVITAGSVAGVLDTSSSKLDANSISDQHSSMEWVTHDESPLEGGGMVENIHSSTPEQEVSKLNMTYIMQSNKSLSLENVYSDLEESDKNSTVVGRKDAEYRPSKIVARKGVTPYSCCPNVTYSENCTICCGEETDDKESMNSKEAGNTVTNSDSNTVIEQQKNRTSMTSHIEIKKSKATKPLYTVDAVNDNVGNISVIQTPSKKLEQGSNNYVVPVVGTILMVPLVAVLSVFFYKKGCEFWERRHYRRMDFLIDGMYND